VSLCLVYMNTGHLDAQFQNYYGFVNSGMLRGIASFFLGIVSYRMFLYLLANPNKQRFIGGIKFFTSMAVIFILFGRTGKYSELDLLAPFVFMFMVTAFSFESGPISQFMIKFKYLGEISYSIYLNQFTVLLCVGYGLQALELPRMLLLLIFLVVLIIYSHWTYLYIEKPLRKLLRRS